jgi:hypothetical protein
MSNTAATPRPEALTALDNMAKPGGDNVSPHLRAAATLNSPECNEAIKNMTAGDGKALAAFTGNGDCTIAGADMGNRDNPVASNASDVSHSVSGQLRPESTVGNDTRYNVSASSDDADVARMIANLQADQMIAA